jgi:putative cofactor-binding repeat protein
MRQRLAMLTVILYVALGAFAYAHHSHFYDECKSITIEGRVERVEFKNPHNLIVLKLDDGTAYTFDWVSLTRLTSAGIIGAAKDAMVSGARVAVTGNLIRNAAEIRRFVPKFKGDVNPNTLEAHSLRRVDDSFSWGLPPRANPPNCDRK